MNKLIDIGVNLTGSLFKKDVSQVIERAQQVGVEQLIITGTNIEHSEQAINLSQQYESVCYSTVGQEYITFTFKPKITAKRRYCLI